MLLADSGGVTGNTVGSGGFWEADKLASVLDDFPRAKAAKEGREREEQVVVVFVGEMMTEEEDEGVRVRVGM